MARMESRPSCLFHGSSLGGPNGSKWLERNLQEMNQSIKRMLELIEEHGDCLTNGADIYGQMKPELIANIEGFHEMYRSLAKYCEYDHLTKESCKSTISDIQLHGPGSSEFSPDQDSLLQTPDGKLDFPKSGFEVVGLDTFPRCDTTGSTLSSKEGNDMSSSSDSESECFNTPAYCHFSTPLDSDGKVLHQKVIEIETELPSLEEKLPTREADLELEKRQVLELQKDCAQLEANVSDADYKNGMLMEELKVTGERLRGSEEEIEKLRHELIDENSEGALQLQGQLEVAREQILRLEGQLDSKRRQVLELQERTYNVDALDRNLQVRELRVALYTTQEQYTQEKTQLWYDVLSLSEKNALLGTKFEELELRSKKLEDKVQLCETEKKALEKMCIEQEVALQSEINQLKLVLTERREHLETLNKDFDRFKQKYDMLISEKDELSAKDQMLMANVSSRDDQVNQMEERFNQLHKRHEELIAKSATAHRLENELKLRVEKLQKEVDRQRVEISECAEEKREAIRQLCFAIEHYRSGYQELRQVIVGHKRQAVIAT